MQDSKSKCGFFKTLVCVLGKLAKEFTATILALLLPDLKYQLILVSLILLNTL